jgi:hypothetical protein
VEQQQEGEKKFLIIKMGNDYVFGEDPKMDLLRASHNISEVLTGKCGRKKKRNKKGVYFKGL